MLIRNYALNAVELTEPVLENAFCKEQDYLRSIECDRLLAGFYETVGLEKKAERYPGGWEDAEIAGHTLGHYMTALSQLFAATGAKDIEERLQYLLQQLAECQAENGYLFTSPEEIFNRLERGETAWVPWYTMHKVLAGLLSAYQLGRQPQALEIAVKLGMWVYGRTKAWTDEVREQVLQTEYGGMNDCLYELYKETGRKEFSEAAAKFDETELFCLIADGKDVLSGKHANTTIPKFLGALNRYFALGEPEAFYLKAAQSFFDLVLENHTYVTGGNSEWEHFRAPGTLGKERTQCNCETCNAHNMLKLAEGLYFVTGEKKYMDFYERTFLNAVLGSQNPETGMTMYFQPMAAGYFKTYSTPYENFWCCTGTGMENFTKLNSAIYHAAENCLYVNLYLSSVLYDKKLNLKLTQKTELSRFDFVIFTLEQEEKRSFTMCFRIPEWTKGRFELRINGEPADYRVKKGYLLVEREWTEKQQISLRFFPEIELHPLPDAPNSAAVTYGPFVMAAGLGKSDMTTEITGVNVTIPTKNVPVREKILVKDVSVREWFANCKKNFVKLEGEVAFFLFGTDADGELVFTPYYKHYNDRYGIYFDYCAEAGLSEGELLELTKKQMQIAELAAKEKLERLRAEADTETVPGASGKRKKAVIKERRAEKSKKRNGWKIAAAHIVGAVICLLLLYLFAAPVGAGLSKAKDAVDAFLQKRMPGVAEVFGIQREGKPLDALTEETVKRYLENPEISIAAWSLPEGFSAEVVRLDGKEYICVQGKGLRAYYFNELREDIPKHVYLQNYEERALFFWNYSFAVPESLCAARGMYNASEIEQYVFFENGRQDSPHLLDVQTLKEYEIVSCAEALSSMAEVVAYTEVGDELLIDTVIGEVSYLFSVPKFSGEFSYTDYEILTGVELAYTPEQDGLRIDAYVMSADKYLGKITGKLTLAGHSYVLRTLDFYAYAEEDYGDSAGDCVIHGVSLAEAKAERMLLVGDLGEQLLIPVRSDLKKHSYDLTKLAKCEDGELTYVENGETISIKGVDVSKYQAEIDWEKVAADGVKFAMIRLGFRGMGTKGTCELDPYFKKNVEGALDAGIAVGVYFFTQATTEEEAREEAAFVIENLKEYEITWPVVYDTEEITSYAAARANSLSKAVRTACAKAFLEEIEKAGYIPMLYANTRWSVFDLNLGELEQYDRWYAYYGSNLYYPYQFTMWQYTASGSVDGINGKADLNISFVDYGAKK